MVMKLMIVDDNTGMREMIRDVVCGENDTVLECSDGTEAVTAYPQFHPDYVLMDIEMKQMDGFSATEKIYQYDPQAKIIFITSYNTSAFRAKAKILHAVGFVTKENLSELNQLLHQ
ncbi:MAG: response regulator [Bacteroidota bacterium]